MKSFSVIGCAALVASLACSGRYDVGGQGPGGAPGSDPSATGGGASAGTTTQGGTVSVPSSGAAPGSGSGGDVDDESSSNGGSPALEGACDEPTAPPPLGGALAEPSLVWERVTRLIEGEGAPPPSKLPKQTTYAWVGDLVTQAFARARQGGDAPGARALLHHWLFGEATPPAQPLEVDLGALLLDEQPVFDQLMLVPVGDHGYGVFSEPAWLAATPTISKRGARIHERVVADGPPLPPANLDESAPASPMMTRRQELVAATSAAVCTACHRMFDGLGYAYGHFDEGGEYEELDDGLPIDTSGTLPLPLAERSFMNVRQLGELLAESCVARQRFVVTLTRAALGLEGLPTDVQVTWVDSNRARIEQAFGFSEGRTYEDFVRAYAQSPLVLQR